MTQILQWIGWFLLQIYEFFESAHIPAAYALSLVVFTLIVKPVSYTHLNLPIIAIITSLVYHKSAFQAIQNAIFI